MLAELSLAQGETEEVGCWLGIEDVQKFLPPGIWETYKLNATATDTSERRTSASTGRGSRELVLANGLRQEKQ